MPSYISLAVQTFRHTRGSATAVMRLAWIDNTVTPSSRVTHNITDEMENFFLQLLVEPRFLQALPLFPILPVNKTNSYCFAIYPDSSLTEQREAQRRPVGSQEILKLTCFGC